MMMATGRRFAGTYDLLHGGLVPKRDYGSYCIVVARCGRSGVKSQPIFPRNNAAKRCDYSRIGRLCAPRLFGPERYV
jgi:hypothetical protein